MSLESPKTKRHCNIVCTPAISEYGRANISIQESGFPSTRKLLCEGSGIEPTAFGSMLPGAEYPLTVLQLLYLKCEWRWEGAESDLDVIMVGTWMLSGSG